VRTMQGLLYLHEVVLPDMVPRTSRGLCSHFSVLEWQKKSARHHTILEIVLLCSPHAPLHHKSLLPSFKLKKEPAWCYTPVIPVHTGWDRRIVSSRPAWATKEDHISRKQRKSFPLQERYMAKYY
jgi:hypothetical protein